MSNKCTIYVLGDICPRWGNSEQFDTHEAEQVFHDIVPLISSGDLTIANLEAPLTNKERKLPKNSMNLKAKPTDAELLANAGIQGVALANNHILDYGREGLLDTIDCLKVNNIFSYGAGSMEECAVPVYRNVHGKTIGIMAFAEQEFNCAIDYGVGAQLWDDLDSIKLIRETRRLCDFLIVQYHGGIEEYIYPSPMLQKRCRAIADAGADLVTCQHSHCVGTRELWNGSEILYGQGNTIFGYGLDDNQWNDGLIIKIVLDDEVNIEYIPIEARQDGEYIKQQEKATEFLERFHEESQKILNPDFVHKSWKQFCEMRRDVYLPMLFAQGRILGKLNRMSKGMVTSLLTKKITRRNTMNLLRCDAHLEVVKTILELDYYGK